MANVVLLMEICTCHAFSYAFPAAFEEDGTLFASVGGWRSETTCHGSQAPFLDICFDKDEAHLAEVDVYLAWTVCTDCGEEILRFEAVGYIVEFLAVAGKEKSSCARAVSNSNDVSLNEGRAVRGRCEGLVVTARSVRCICY